MNIVIPDHIELEASARKRLEQYSGIRIYDDTVNDPNVIIDRVKDAGIVTANFIDFTAEIIEQSPQLKYIIAPAVGYDWIAVDAATKHGIRVLNCPTHNSQAVVEHAVALMFAVNRKIILAHQSILRGEYPRDFVGTEVKDKHLVTVGYGNVGKKIVEMAKGLGMNASWTDSKTSGEQLDELITRADVLVLCLPLNDSTRGIMNKKRLESMKSTAILINVARGLIVDQETLYDVLNNNKIRGAGIDTFVRDETIREAREDIISFAKLPNVVATPHIAFNTIETSRRLGGELIDVIESCLAGMPINVVNEKKYV